MNRMYGFFKRIEARCHCVPHYLRLDLINLFLKSNPCPLHNACESYRRYSALNLFLWSLGTLMRPFSDACLLSKRAHNSSLKSPCTGELRNNVSANRRRQTHALLHNPCWTHWPRSAFQYHLDYEELQPLPRRTSPRWNR